VRNATISERAKQFLEDKDVEREDVRFFLLQLLELGRLCGQSAAKGISRGVLAALFFVLLSNPKITEAELAGVKIEEFSFFRLILPVAISYFSLQTVLALDAHGLYTKIYREIIKRHYPAWHKSDFSELLMTWPGPLSMHLGPIHFDFSEHPGLHKIRMTAAISQMASAIVVPIAFGAYAYIRLFEDNRIPDLAAKASLTVAVVLMGASALLLILLGFTRVVDGKMLS